MNRPAAALLSAVLVLAATAACTRRPAAPPPQAPPLRYGVGLETAGGFQLLLPAGQPLPVARSQGFPAQGAAPFRATLAQRRPDGLVRLGEVEGPPLPAGATRTGVVVTLEVDAARHLHVTVAPQERRPRSSRSYGPFAVE